MRVDIERILALRAELRAINELDLASIEFYKDGKKVDFPAEDIEEWRFTGLNNVDFIEMR